MLNLTLNEGHGFYEQPRLPSVCAQTTLDSPARLLRRAGGYFTRQVTWLARAHRLVPVVFDVLGKRLELGFLE